MMAGFRLLWMPFLKQNEFTEAKPPVYGRVTPCLQSQSSLFTLR